MIVVELLNCIWLFPNIYCSTPGFLVLHYLPKFTKTHVHWVSDDIQPSHPQSPPSLPAPSLPCPSLPPGVYSNSGPLSQWWHPTISSSVAPFSSCPQSFLQDPQASGSFPVSPLFISGSQSIEASVSVSILSMNIQRWFPLGWTGLISFGILSPCLFNLYAEYIMQNARLGES